MANVSPIWNSYRQDFSERGSFRGYAQNRVVSDKKIRIIRRLCRPFRPKRPGRAFAQKYLFLLYVIYERLVCLVVVGDSRAAERYVLTKFPDSTYPEDQLERFKIRFCRHGLFFSHNSFKSFSYLESIEKYTQLPLDVVALEIGGGLLNFQSLLILERQSYAGVVIDLPEVSRAAVLQLKDQFKDGVDVFIGESQIENFVRSSASKKLLFLEPNEIHRLPDLGLPFNFFINHESFAEMPIAVVNNYIIKSLPLLTSGSLVSLVNRISRIQYKENSELQSIALGDVTNFSDYDLTGIETIVKEIDRFRQGIPGQREAPNVFFLGRTASND